MNVKTKKPIEPAHKLEITLEPAGFTEEKSAKPSMEEPLLTEDRYALYAHYQKSVHKDSHSSKMDFKSFLCGGLGQSVYGRDGKSRKIGSYHQCYRLDGKLVAMGVLDLLPHCVSSVYLL